MHLMNKRNITVIALLSIFILSVIVRIVGFGTVPSELNRDEAALGYSAYSLIHSGKDEWGTPYPIVFRSFGDYKLAGYIYALIPGIKLFGLSIETVRLPSMIAGILLVFATYLFVQQFFKNRMLSILSSFFIAIAPWAIHYSHVGFEANLALCLFVFGLYFFIQKTFRTVFFGALLLFLSLLTYNAPLILLPFFIVILCITKYINLQKVAVLIALSSLAFLLVFPASKGKGAITLFSDPTIEMQRMQSRVEMGNSLLARVLTQKYVYALPNFIKNYVSIFSPNFLVQTGGRNPWHQAVGWGHVYVMMYIFAILGLGVCIQHILDKKIQITKKQPYIVVLSMFLLSSLPSAVTVDAPHATRSLFFLFLISIMSAFGVVQFVTVFKGKIKLALIALITLVCLISLYTYMFDYMGKFKNIPQIEWNKGLGEAILKTQTIDPKETVVILGDTHYTYIYPLFYLHTSVDQFRNTVTYEQKDILGFMPVSKVGRFIFAGQVPEGYTGYVIGIKDSTYELYSAKLK